MRLPYLTGIISAIGFIIALVAYLAVLIVGSQLGDLGDFLGFLALSGVYGWWINFGLVLGFVFLGITIFILIFKLG